MSTRPAVARETFVASRGSDYLTRRGLVSQTGQPEHRFADVVLKELVDNALDAAEMAGTAPEIAIAITQEVDERARPCQRIMVADNGPGIPARTVAHALDFDVLVSDKAAYRSCTRGLQGNALKTVFGIASSRGSTRPVVIATPEVTHRVAAHLDPSGAPEVHHERDGGGTNTGTRVEVTVPWTQHECEAAAPTFDPVPWARGYALVNPHATITVTGGLASSHGDERDAVSYKATVDQSWSKPLTSDPTSPHWYSTSAFAALVYSHVNAAKQGGRDLPLGEFIRRFAGLTSTAKAKRVAARMPGIDRLSDLAATPQRIAELHATMKALCRPPRPKTLGAVPEEHYRTLLGDWYGVQRFWFKRVVTTYDGCPLVAELAVAETERAARLHTAVNYAPTFDDPLGRATLIGGDRKNPHPMYGAKAALDSMDALPTWENGHRRAAVIHLITPAASFLDKGKSTLAVAS